MVNYPPLPDACGLRPYTSSLSNEGHMGVSLWRETIHFQCEACKMNQREEE